MNYKAEVIHNNEFNTDSMLLINNGKYVCQLMGNDNPEKTYEDCYKALKDILND